MRAFAGFTVIPGIIIVFDELYALRLFKDLMSGRGRSFWNHDIRKNYARLTPEIPSRIAALCMPDPADGEAAWQHESPKTGSVGPVQCGCRPCRVWMRKLAETDSWSHSIRSLAKGK